MNDFLMHRILTCLVVFFGFQISTLYRRNSGKNGDDIAYFEDEISPDCILILIFVTSIGYNLCQNFVLSSTKLGVFWNVEIYGEIFL